MMGVNTYVFGLLPDGREVTAAQLQGIGGLTATIINYGATIQSLVFQGKDVVLGYDQLKTYRENNHSYQGATIGRYGNRLSPRPIMLDGISFTAPNNESGRWHLHGGFEGFDRKLWTMTPCGTLDEPAVSMTYVSPDGEEGYPGTLRVQVTFTVTADNALRITYYAETDKPTVLNLTNHAYFNLHGFDDGDVLDTMLQLDADAITAVDDKLLPTGELLSVEGTAFDFRSPKPIGRELEDAHPQMRLGGGYDHNFVLKGTGFRKAVVAYSPKSGITMACYTDQPGVQLYTANFLQETEGKGNIPLYKHQGFCLETQHFPDSPSNPQFPSTRLDPGQSFTSVTEYRFSGTDV